MKSIYSDGENRVLLREIQYNFKYAIHSWSNNSLGLRYIFKALKGMLNLPEPTREGGNRVRTVNAKILVDVRDEFFSYFNTPFYIKIIKTVVNFIIVKIDYDGFYSALVDWFFKETLMRGWQFCKQYRPSPIRVILEEVLRENYDKEGFIDKVVGEFENRVTTWRCE